MPSTGIFEGFIRIGAGIVSTGVKVFLSGIDAAVSKPDETSFAKERILLRPFSPEMLSCAPDAAKMKDGLAYTIKGNSIGGYLYGPLGHPGDGDYDHWPMSEFSVEAKFSASFLTVTIHAVTGPGTSGIDATRTYSPLQIEVQFRVPKADMVRFLQIPNGPDKYFKERVALCG